MRLISTTGILEQRYPVDALICHWSDKDLFLARYVMDPVAVGRFSGYRPAITGSAMCHARKRSLSDQ